MVSLVDRVAEEIGQWSKGVLVLRGPARPADVQALEDRIGRQLPSDYRALLSRWDGADLRGDRLLSASEALAQYEAMPSLLAPVYHDDPDWPYPDPPHELVPIAVDLEGNLKCLDASTDHWELVDWHRETATITTWHTSAAAWILATLRALAVRFDPRGRPRPLRAAQAATLDQLELEAALSADPAAAHGRLEHARWLAHNRPPEIALEGFRQAAEGVPERALNHYEHGRFALVTGREAEARSALRRCLAVPAAPNPRKHSFRTGYLPAAHTLLQRLYERVGQTRKADEQRRAAQRATKRYGFGWYAESAEYQEALRSLYKGEP